MDLKDVLGQLDRGGMERIAPFVIDQPGEKLKIDGVAGQYIRLGGSCSHCMNYEEGGGMQFNVDVPEALRSWSLSVSGAARLARPLDVLVQEVANGGLEHGFKVRKIDGPVVWMELKVAPGVTIELIVVVVIYGQYLDVLGISDVIPEAKTSPATKAKVTVALKTVRNRVVLALDQLLASAAVMATLQPP